jgi:hypothetical protein
MTGRGKASKYCDGCAYWRTTSGGKMCHFALDTHRCRLVPADGCPHHTKKGENMASKIDGARARELYDQGMSDGDIGKEFGVSSSSIFQWRKKNNLQSQNPPKRKQKPEHVYPETPPEEVLAEPNPELDAMVYMAFTRAAADLEAAGIDPAPHWRAILADIEDSVNVLSRFAVNADAKTYVIALAAATAMQQVVDA